MWQQYRKTALFVQAFIVLACLGLYFLKGLPVPMVLLFFAIMEVGSVLGAWWAARLKRRLGPTPDTLPLHNRL